MSESDKKMVAVPVTSAALPKYPAWGPKWLRGMVGFAVGAMLIDMALTALGVRIEWFEGISTFSFSWVTAMTVVPVLTGVVVGAIYGFGGKYLAHFPPVGTLGWDYYESVTHTLPQGVHLIPWPLWGFFLILQMEFCAAGGVIGELLVRRYYGWDPEMIHSADSEPLPEDEADSGGPR